MNRFGASIARIVAGCMVHMSRLGLRATMTHVPIGDVVSVGPTVVPIAEVLLLLGARC
jgi:hypothetical protein